MNDTFGETFSFQKKDKEEQKKDYHDSVQLNKTPTLDIDKKVAHKTQEIDVKLLLSDKKKRD